MARVTENKEYTDKAVGDRNLALFIEKDSFHFSTYDTLTDNGDMFINMPF